MLVAALICLLMLGAGEALAIPANDDYPGTVIGGVPYEDSVDTTGSTLEPDEPQGLCSPIDNSVWWTITPAETGAYVVTVSTGGTFAPILTVWRDSLFPAGGLAEVACGGFPAFPDEPVLEDAWATFPADAGETYYIQVGGFGFFDLLESTGPVTLSVTKAEPPANDMIADAIEIGSLPFVHEVDFTGATTEPGEPQSPCVNDPAFGIMFGTTVWYKYTPSESGPVIIDLLASFAFPTAVVWSGEPGNFTEVGCGFFIGFQAEAGETYYIQIGEWYSVDFPLIGGIVELRMQHLVVPECPADTHTVNDPHGDTMQWRPRGAFPLITDVERVRVGTGPETTCISLDFAGPIGPPVHNWLEALGFDLMIDTDSDPNTGWQIIPDPEYPCASQGPLGFEAEFFVTHDGSMAIPVPPQGPVPFGVVWWDYAVITTTEDSMTLAVPSHAIGDGTFNMAIIASDASAVDCVPNNGVIEIVGPVLADFGDVDCDDALAGGDAWMILALLAGVEASYPAGCPQAGEPLPGIYPAGGAQLVSGDVDCSGAVTALDALLLLRGAAGSPTDVGDGCPQLGTPALGPLSGDRGRALPARATDPPERSPRISIKPGLP